MTHRVVPWLALALGIGLIPPADAQTGTWALTNARIQTVANGVIERGVILVRSGLIEAVGTAVAVPADARVIDLAGRTVTPGLIDLWSSIGQTSEPPRPPGGAAASPAPAPVGRAVGLDPSRSAATDLRLPPADLKAAREAGITAILVAAGRGAFRGTSALAPTADSAGLADLIKPSVALHMGFQSGQGGYPGTLLGVIAYQRQMLYDAQRHAILADRYRTDPKGLSRPAHDPGLEALVPVVRKRLPVFFESNNENEIRRAVRIAREFDLALTVVGATEGFRAIDALKGQSAVVSVNFPRPTDATGWAYRLARRGGPDSLQADSVTRRAMERNAAVLHQAGVRFALGSGGIRPGEFLTNVRKAIKAGLPAEAALAAMTLRAAELVGLERSLGSIEPGKIANLVVTERGDLLGDSARVREVFVDGVRYEVVAPPPARAGATTAPAEIAGTWTMSVTTPQGANEVTLTITQSGASFTGQMASQMGTSAIDDGQIAGRSVSWSTSIAMGGQSVTLTFQGQVEGSRMTGSATLGSFGSATFTAEKRP
ncbi:MAG: amidohydrolase family protein [Gemmatimonadales bacterium]